MTERDKMLAGELYNALDPELVQDRAALKDPAQKNNRDDVDIIIALGMAKEGFDWIWREHALTVRRRLLPQ